MAQLLGFMQQNESATALEDYVVILQKASSRDAAAIIALLDQRLVEKLHALLNQLLTPVSADKENFMISTNS